VHHQNPTKKKDIMKNFKQTFGLMTFCIAMVFGISSCMTATSKKDEIVSMAEVPKAVQKTIKAYAMEAEINKIEKCDEDGRVVYEAKVIRNGSNKVDGNACGSSQDDRSTFRRRKGRESREDHRKWRYLLRSQGI